MSTKRNKDTPNTLYMVSCRRNFDSKKELADGLVYARHGSYRIQSPKPIMFSAFRELVCGRHVCILVHGFNNTYADVTEAYGAMQLRMKSQGLLGGSQYDLVLGFAWPSFGDSGWLNAPKAPAEFKEAVKSANRCGEFLHELIRELREASVLSVDIQTHSLGARVALQALKMNHERVYVEHLLLSAPAVDHHVLERGGEFQASMEKCGRCFVYHSSHDGVLKLAFPIGDKGDGIHPALGLRGPADKNKLLQNVYVVNAGADIKDHSGYRSCNAYYAHWLRVLQGEEIKRAGKLR